VTRCRATGKVRQPALAKAEAQQRSIVARGLQGEGELKTYWCHFCHAFHVGHVKRPAWTEGEPQPLRRGPGGRRKR
jgi:hypothetical protein